MSGVVTPGETVNVSGRNRAANWLVNNMVYPLLFPPPFLLSEHPAIHDICVLTLRRKDAVERLWVPGLICRSAPSFILEHQCANCFLLANLIARLIKSWRLRFIYTLICLSLCFLPPALSQDQLSQRQWTSCCFKKCEHFLIKVYKDVEYIRQIQLKATENTVAPSCLRGTSS